MKFDLDSNELLALFSLIQEKLNTNQAVASEADLVALSRVHGRLRTCLLSALNEGKAKASKQTFAAFFDREQRRIQLLKDLKSDKDEVLNDESSDPLDAVFSADCYPRVTTNHRGLKR